MDFPCRIKDLFPVDLGVDLKALQPEITQCKRRFQQDLWNTICNRVLEEQSNWKKDGKGGSKSEEKEPGDSGGDGGESKGSDEKTAEEEEEPKPEESGENENNATWGNRSNSQRQVQGRGRNVGRQRPMPPPPPPPPKPPQNQRQHQYQHRPRGLSGVQRQEAYYLARQQLPLPRRFGFGGAVGGGELSNFLRRIQPLEGVLDWRGSSGGSRTRVVVPSNNTVSLLPPAAGHVASSATARSFSATSRREILGIEDSTDAASVDASEAFQDSQVFHNNSTGIRVGGGAGYISDGDLATFYLNNAAEDRATGSTDAATREFVPLMVGNWWACGQRSEQHE